VIYIVHVVRIICRTVSCVVTIRSVVQIAQLIGSIMVTETKHRSSCKIADSTWRSWIAAIVIWVVSKIAHENPIADNFARKKVCQAAIRSEADGLLLVFFRPL